MSNTTTPIIPPKDSPFYKNFRSSQRFTDLMVSHFCAASASHRYIDELEDILRGIYDGSIITPTLIQTHRGPARKLSTNTAVWIMDKPDRAQIATMMDEIADISSQGKTADLANIALDNMLFMDQDVVDHLRRKLGIRQPEKPPINVTLMGSSGGVRFEDVTLHADLRHGEWRGNGFCDANLIGCNFYHSSQQKLFTRNAHFETCDLTSARLSDSVLTDSTFKNCGGIQADFTNVTFKDCVFDHCDFTGAHFRGCTFENCTFINTEMKDAHIIQGTSFKGRNSVLGGILNADHIHYSGDVTLADDVPHAAGAYDPVQIMLDETGQVRRATYDGNVGYPEQHRDPDQLKYTDPSAPSGSGVSQPEHGGKGAHGQDVEALIAAGEKAGKVARFPTRSGGSGSGKQ